MVSGSWLTKKVRSERKSLTEAQADSKAAPGTRLWLMSSHWSTCGGGSTELQAPHSFGERGVGAAAAGGWGSMLQASGGRPAPAQRAEL